MMGVPIPIRGTTTTSSLRKTANGYSPILQLQSWRKIRSNLSHRTNIALVAPRLTLTGYLFIALYTGPCLSQRSTKFAKSPPRTCVKWYQVQVWAPQPRKVATWLFRINRYRTARSSVLPVLQLSPHLGHHFKVFSVLPSHPETAINRGRYFSRSL